MALVRPLRYNKANEADLHRKTARECKEMKLMIGENIKRLRRERDMTQEELAEQLGVTFQSVSRWENNACYPDMEMVPVIAEFFDISVDKLMGLDAEREAAEVQLILGEFQSAISRGEIESCIAIARAGLKAHPGSYALMNKLMYALFVSSDDTGNIPNWKENMLRYDEEITQLGERIMKYCPDPAIRQEAIGRLAFNHCEMGRKQQGRAVYEMLPTMDCTREEQIWYALEDDERAANARDLIKKGYSAVRAGIWRLLDCADVPDADKAEIALARVKMDEIVDGDNPPPNIGQWRVRVAQVLARLGRTDEAMAQLNVAAAQAKVFDERPECGEYETPLLGRRVWKRTDYETADTRPVAQIMRESWLAHEDFDSIRDAEGFKTVLKLLEE